MPAIEDFKLQNPPWDNVNNAPDDFVVESITLTLVCLGGGDVVHIMIMPTWRRLRLMLNKRKGGVNGNAGHRRLQAAKSALG
jgi:hypothetical protein